MITDNTNCELLTARVKAEAVCEHAYVAVERILRKRGWGYTCSTPESFWMWEKKLKDGRTVLCNRDLAVQFEIQESGEEWPDTDD